MVLYNSVELLTKAIYMLIESKHSRNLKLKIKNVTIFGR